MCDEIASHHLFTFFILQAKWWQSDSRQNEKSEKVMASNMNKGEMNKWKSERSNMWHKLLRTGCLVIDILHQFVSFAPKYNLVEPYIESTSNASLHILLFSLVHFTCKVMIWSIMTTLMKKQCNCWQLFKISRHFCFYLKKYYLTSRRAFYWYRCVKGNTFWSPFFTTKLRVW